MNFSEHKVLNDCVQTTNLDRTKQKALLGALTES